MSIGASWIAVYLGILLMAALRTALTRQPILVRGSSFFRFNCIAALLLAAALLIRVRPIPLAAAGFCVTLLLASWPCRRLWVIAGAGRERVENAFERSFERVRAPSERSAEGYAVKIGEGKTLIEIRCWPAGMILIRFRVHEPGRKLTLLLDLVAKQFESPLPHLRIDTR